MLLGTLWTKLCQVSITYMTLARNLHGPFELFSQLLGVIVKFGGQGKLVMFWKIMVTKIQCCFDGLAEKKWRHN